MFHASKDRRDFIDESIIKTFSIKMIEYVGMSKPKKYVNKVGMGNSRNKIKQTNSI